MYTKWNANVWKADIQRCTNFISMVFFLTQIVCKLDFVQFQHECLHTARNDVCAIILFMFF